MFPSRHGKSGQDISMLPVHSVEFGSSFPLAELANVIILSVAPDKVATDNSFSSSRLCDCHVIN